MGNARRFFDRRREENDVGAINRNLTAKNNAFGILNRKPSSYSTNTFLQTTGGVLSGSIGFDSSSLTIQTGVLTLYSNTTSVIKPKKIVYLSVESGTSDTLTKINTNGNELAGQSLIIVGNNASHTITVSHDVSVSENDRAILCPSNTSFTLSGDNAIELFYDSTNSKWVIIGNTGTGGGGGGVSYPLTPSVNVVGSVSTGTTTIDLSASNAHSTTMTATGNSALAFSNYPSSGNQIEWEVEITQDSTGGRTITMPSEVVEDPGIVTTANTTSVIVFRTNDGGTTVHVVSLLNASPSLTSTGATKELDNLTTTSLNADLHLNTFNIDEIDKLVFDKSAGDTLGSTDTGVTSNAAGGLEFNLSGTTNSYDFIMNNDSTIRLQINNTTVVSQSLFPVDSGSDTLGSSGAEWFTGHILTMTNTTANITTGNITTGNITNIVSGGATNGITSIGHLDFVDNTATPSASLSLYTDGTDIFANTGGSVKNLSDISSTTGANQQLSNLSGTVSVNLDLIPNQATGGNLGSSTSGKEWYNLFSRRVTFPASTSLGASDYTFGRVSTDVKYNVPTGSTHIFTVNGSTQLTITSAELNLSGVNLDMENNSITDTNQLQITGTTGDTIRGFLSGSTGNFDITANENDSSINLYARRSSGTLEKLLEVNGNTGGVVVGTGVVSLLTFGDSGNPSQITRLNDDMTLNAAGHLELDIGGVTKLDITSTDIIVNEDLDVSTGNYLDLPDTSTTSSGTTLQLPQNGSGNTACEGFIKIKVNGVIKKLPYYS